MPKQLQQLPYFLVLFLIVGFTLSACDMGTQPGVVAPDDDIVVVEPENTPVTDTVLTDTVATTDTVAQELPAADEGPLVLAYTLMDQSFVNADGEISGEIEDLIIDLRTGHVFFAQIEYGGFLDIGDTELLVPLRALRWRSIEQDMILGFDEQLLESYPELTDLTEGSPRLDDPSWYDGIAAFWTDLGFGGDTDAASTFDPTTDVVVRASDLLGFSLVDIGGGVGRIQNMLIDLNSSRAPYLLIGFGTTAAGDDAYMIPFSAVDIIDVDANEIALDANIALETLQLAPRFDRLLFQRPLGAIDPIYREQADTFWEEQGVTLEQ
jgi:sporulation protein YlmC with PRC-barrel domain